MLLPVPVQRLPGRVSKGLSITYYCRNIVCYDNYLNSDYNNIQQQYQYSQQQYNRNQNQKRNYYTNADQVKKNDPYAILGLSYGDGATSQEIREAFRKQAAILHPDVNTIDSPTVAREKFQTLQRAYEILLKNKTNNSDGNDNNEDDEWRFKVWNQGDRIACDRTDVAGLKRQRPIIPPTKQESFRSVMIGHPRQHRSGRRRGEYLDDGSGTPAAPSTNQSGGTVGRGWNKWVDRSKVQYVPWNTIAESKLATSNESTSTDNINNNNNNNEKGRL